MTKMVVLELFPNKLINRCKKTLLSPKERAYKRAVKKLYEETNIVHMVKQLRSTRKALDLLLTA